MLTSPLPLSFLDTYNLSMSSPYSFDEISEPELRFEKLSHSSLARLYYFFLSSLFFYGVRFQSSKVLAIFLLCKRSDNLLICPLLSLLLSLFWFLQVFHTSFSWWSSTGVWVITSFQDSSQYSGWSLPCCSQSDVDSSSVFQFLQYFF